MKLGCLYERVMNITKEEMLDRGEQLSIYGVDTSLAFKVLCYEVEKILSDNRCICGKEKDEENFI